MKGATIVTITDRDPVAEQAPVIRPYRVEVPQADLDDLRARLAATRWPDKETVSDRSQGARLTELQELVRYWGTEYDWRNAEAQLNAFPQFMTTIDGVEIHFIHVATLSARDRCSICPRSAGAAMGGRCSSSLAPVVWLLGHGADTERWFRTAIDRLGRTRVRAELGRTHLRYGEWLRREGRRVDARAELTVAHDLFTTMGTQAFAARARTELTATGEKARRRSEVTRDELTAHERQIAQPASAGLSNADIAARLFLSRRTVEWHLRQCSPSSGPGLGTSWPTP